MGKQVPPYTIPGRTLDGLNIACLTSATDISMDAGIAASIVYVTNETDSSETSSFKRAAAATDYCLIDSYNWVGSDFIRPDCTLASNLNDPQCLDPTNVTDAK